MRRLMILTTIAAVASVALTQTQTPARSPSADGMATVQVGVWTADDPPGARITAGKWIDILYGRPLKRGRADLFGSGASYGAALTGGAAVWRAGANLLTRLRTEAPLVFGTKTVPAGEYTLFIDLKSSTDWTLILSSQKTNVTDDVPTRSKQWAAFVYAPEMEVVRAPMKIDTLPYSIEELTFAFTDVTGTSATLRLMWDTVMASVPFTVAR